MNTAIPFPVGGPPASSEEPTPEYWMAQLKAGREEALAHLMARFERPLFAFLHRRLQGDAGGGLPQVPAALPALRGGPARGRVAFYAGG